MTNDFSIANKKIERFGLEILSLTIENNNYRIITEKSELSYLMNV